MNVDNLEPTIFTPLDEKMHQLLAAYNVPGAQLAIVRDEKLDFFLVPYPALQVYYSG